LWVTVAQRGFFYEWQLVRLQSPTGPDG
jgi:hypothetical protein